MHKHVMLPGLPTGTEFPYLLRKCVPKYGNTDDGQVSTKISKTDILNWGGDLKSFWVVFSVFNWSRNNIYGSYKSAKKFKNKMSSLSKTNHFAVFFPLCYDSLDHSSIYCNVVVKGTIL